jgi:threonine dehydrogenase-like Zn-dependent dehydrogenase
MDSTNAFMVTGHRTGQISHFRLPRGEVTVKVEACGLCQRDVGIWSGEIPRHLPEVLGHEVVGTIVDSGPHTPWPDGTRVAGMGNHGLAHHMRVPAWQLSPVAGAGPQLTLVEPLACAVNACEQDPSPAQSPAVVVGLGMLGQMIAALLTAAGRLVIATDRDPDRLALAAASGAQVHEPHSTALRIAIGEAGAAYECTGSADMLWQLTTGLPPGGALLLVAHHRTGSATAQLLDQWHLRGINIRNAVPRTASNMGDCVRTAASLPIDLARYPIRTGPLADAGRLLDSWPAGRVMRHVVLIDPTD